VLKPQSGVNIKWSIGHDQHQQYNLAVQYLVDNIIQRETILPNSGVANTKIRNILGKRPGFRRLSWRQNLSFVIIFVRRKTSKVLSGGRRILQTGAICHSWSWVAGAVASIGPRRDGRS
jgi:hypothetical protein